MVIVRPTRTHPLVYWAYIFLAGLTIPPTVRVVLFPHCELIIVTIGSLALTEKHTRSYAYPVPGGTSVPYWARLTVTVR